MIQPGVFLGDITDTADERVDRLHLHDHIVGFTPIEGSGYLIRAVHLLVQREFTPNSGTSWVLQVCRQSGGEEPTTVAEITLGSSIRPVVRRHALSPYPRIPPGSVVLVRLAKNGRPGSISGLSIALEYGITGVR